MKKITILLFCLTLLFNTYAQYYTPKEDKQAVNFIIKNFGLTVNGSFSGLQGHIVFNTSNLTAASFKVSVDAGTVNTGNSSRDGHLKKEEYFNVATFQKISIVSSKITNGNSKGTYLFEGVLSIKGTNKVISFPFTATTTTDGFIFSGSFKINRQDFKVGGNSIILSDNLTVNLNVSTKKS
jgi:polyisoprenoid-binding protein YceI